MASSHFFRIDKLKGNNGVLGALKHNKRELQAEHGALANIDVARTSLNYALAGLSDATIIARHAKAQMIYAGIEKPRKNGVMAVEVVFSLPIDRHQQDTKPFFTDCHKWILKTFAGELLSFDVHLDESAPHAHALILPLIGGKMQGNKMVGGTGNLMRLINLFHTDVAQHHGLSRSTRKRLNAKDRQGLEKLVLTSLKSDSVMKSSVWACVRDAIHNDPLPYAQILSIRSDKATSKASK